MTIIVHMYGLLMLLLYTHTTGGSVILDVVVPVVTVTLCIFAGVSFSVIVIWYIIKGICMSSSNHC